MLAKQGLQIVPLSRNTSPAPGQRSNCGSVSEAAKGLNDAPLVYSEDDDLNPKWMVPDEDHDTISGLSEPTPCALIHNVGGHQAEVAWGTVYTRQFELHTVPIQPECAVVNVELLSGMILCFHSLRMMRSQNLERLSCKGYSGRGLLLLLDQSKFLHRLWPRQ